MLYASGRPEAFAIFHLDTRREIVPNIPISVEGADIRTVTKNPILAHEGFLVVIFVNNRTLSNTVDLHFSREGKLTSIFVRFCNSRISLRIFS